jgi:hypothetical protein
MSSTLNDIADSLAASLADIEWSSVETQPTVERVTWPTYTVEEMGSPVMAVTPGTIEAARISRDKHQQDYSVNVFVGRAVGNQSEADAMLDLAEELLDAIRSHEFDNEWPEGVTSPVAITININPDDALQERNVWRAVITSTYRVFK